MRQAKAFPRSSRLLLDHGVDVNARYGNDLTALMWAAGYTDEAGVDDVTKVMNLLLERGAHIDDQDDRGRTALMIAAELDHEAAADLLLSHGADKTLRTSRARPRATSPRSPRFATKLAARVNSRRYLLPRYWSI